MAHNLITVLDNIARGIGWPVLLLVIFAVLGVFVWAGITGFVPTVYDLLDLVP